MANQAAQPPGRATRRERTSYETEFGRIVAFSDGVFAIAITLLVLSIEVPSVDPDALGDALRDLDGDVVAYFIGFAVIGMFWYGHSAAYSHLERATGSIVVTNLAFLSMIALMPFTTAVLGAYDEPIAVAVYAANVGLAATLDSVIDQIAARQRLYGDHVDPDRRALDAEGILRAAVFLVSIPLAFVSVTLAQLFWLLLFVTPILARRIAARNPST